MKATLYSAVAVFLLMISASAQSTETAQPHNAGQASQTLVGETPAAQLESAYVEQMRADVERLKVLLNQMRTNLAFVQTSQTPLKHQFELETDAWQVIVDQMDRRLKQMEERKSPGSAR